MKEKEMAKYAVAIGAVLLLIGVGMQTVPAIQSMGDVTVDSTPPANEGCQPPPSTTSDDPSVIDYEGSGDSAWGTIFLDDAMSGMDVSTMSITCTNVTQNTTVYSKSWGEFHWSTSSSDGDSIVGASEYVRNHFSDSDGDGQYELPQGDKFKFEMSGKDIAGNEFSETGWYRVKVGAPGGDWYMNGKSWSTVEYITSNSITFKFEATKNSGNVTGAEVDIDKQDNTDVKEVTLSETSTDTWTGSTTLSDGKYTIKGIVNGSIIAQVNMGLNREEPEYGNWLAYAFTGIGLISMLGGSWKLASLL